MIAWRHLGYDGARALILTPQSTELSLSYNAVTHAGVESGGVAGMRAAVHSAVLSRVIK